MAFGFSVYEQEYFRKKVLTLRKTCAILDLTCERGFFVVRFFAFQAATDRSRQGGSKPSPEEG